MDDAYIESVIAQSDSARYPEGFLEDYEALECLAHSDAGETLLVKSRQTDQYFVAKCYTEKSLLSQVTEGDILKQLDHPGLPRYAGEYTSGMLCVVREYVEGTPLDQYAAQNVLSEAKVVSLALELCDILSYLHSQSPPVIHRDIKPQNIIIDKKGCLRLIDFGISRIYDKDATEDTVCYGTKHFAPPEQYGFAQTNSRADIFSLGVLLGWLLTGELELRSMLHKITNRKLLRIVKRCTAFAPEKRYASADKVRADLLNVDGRKQKRAIRWACAVLACVVCLCAGFALGRFTDFSPAIVVSSRVVFKEPLVEQAVRMTLQKDAEEPIEERDLLSVTELYIYGNQAAENTQKFDELGEQMAFSDGVLINGGMTSLEDLSKLKNLKVLRIALEDISDLSPLSGLEALEIIDLRHNPVEDVSPLATLPALREICLYESRVSDLSSLSSCLMLETIEVGKTQISSMNAFQGLTNLKNLFLTDTPLQSLSGIESLTRLERLRLPATADGDLRLLLNLPKLKELHLAEALRQAAEEELKDAGFSINYS